MTSETGDKPMPYLEDPTGRAHTLKDDVVTLGRATTNHIVITSKRVSREHARISRDGWRRILEDLGSTNGTLLNTELVSTPRELRDRDRIEIGDVHFIFHDPDITYRDTIFPELEIDLGAGLVRVNRHPIELSPKEFVLLAYLHAHANEVCSKDDIARAVWPEYESDVYDYQIENLVRRLRAKIEPDVTAPQILTTLRGLGYKLASR